MSLLGRLVQRQRLRHSADRALMTNLPLVQTPLNALPSAAMHPVPPLSAEHLNDLWPDHLLRNHDPGARAIADNLRGEFRWIAATAGHKLHNLYQSSLSDDRRHREEAEIIAEARIFATIAVRSTVEQLNEGHCGADIDPGDGGRGVDADRHTVMATEPLPITTSEHEGTESRDARLNRLLGFVVRQEPRLAWAVGDRSDDSTILVTDIAHGWIPPRIALPAGVNALPPARTRIHSIDDLLVDVDLCAVYIPGESLPPSEPSQPTASAQTGLHAAAVENLVQHLAEYSAERIGIPSAVRSLLKAAAAGSATTAGLPLIYTHLDAARQQLLSDYPLVDNSVLGDCMLLSAVEGCLTEDLMLANYHYAWFTAIHLG